MKISLTRDELLKPLQQVSGVVEKRQTLQVLSNVLLEVSDNVLSLTGTDLEVELLAKQTLETPAVDGKITVPCRKLFDICRALPASASVTLSVEENRLLVRSGKSRFTLTTLPANDFPNLDDTLVNAKSVAVSQRTLKQLIDKTAFAMAQQDVRYYLNGMLFEISPNQLRLVSTDGHRLAMADTAIQTNLQDSLQVIVPRKGVQELSRLLTDDDSVVTLTIASNHIRVTVGNVIFTSKLIDGRFPDYERVLPKNGDRTLSADREELRSSLQRAAILCNEKFRGIRLNIHEGTLKITATNPDQEQAEEEMPVDYSAAPLEIGFNVGYLLDVLSVLHGATTNVILGDSNSSALIKDSAESECSAVYVVMPMRL